MLEVAESFGILTKTTLELMSLMQNCKYIQMKKIKEIVVYWEYIEDKPANFRKDYNRLFKKK